MQSEQGPDATPTQIAIIVLAVIAVAAVGYVMRSVLLPIVLAAFFAALGRPIQVRLQRWIGHAAALVVTVLLIGASLVALPLLFAANLQVVIARIPTYAPRINAVIADIEKLAADAGFEFKLFDLTSESTLETLLSYGTELVYGVLDFLGTVALVIFLIFFILGEARTLRAKLAAALRPTNHATVTASFTRIQERIQQYVTTKTLFAVLDALACFIITWALGIDFPLLWTLLTFTLYFIPNIGVIIATFPPVLLALVQFPEPTTALVCFVLLLVSFNLLGNVLEPKLLGRALSLSPLVVVSSLLVWGWYLGPLGVVLAVPLTVMFRIIFENIEQLQPIAVLMSDRADRIARRTDDEG
jgi:AI-2 transport protein TqsA